MLLSYKDLSDKFSILICWSVADFTLQHSAFFVQTYNKTFSFSAQDFFWIMDDCMRYAVENQWNLSKVNRLLGKQVTRQTEDELAINTMQSYIDVVFYQGTMALAAETLDESKRILYKTKRMEELGLKGKAEVAQIEAQVEPTIIFLPIGKIFIIMQF